MEISNLVCGWEWRMYDRVAQSPAVDKGNCDYENKREEKNEQKYFDKYKKIDIEA